MPHEYTVEWIHTLFLFAQEPLRNPIFIQSMSDNYHWETSWNLSPWHCFIFFFLLHYLCFFYNINYHSAYHQFQTSKVMWQYISFAKAPWWPSGEDYWDMKCTVMIWRSWVRTPFRSNVGCMVFLSKSKAQLEPKLWISSLKNKEKSLQNIYSKM